MRKSQNLEREKVTMRTNRHTKWQLTTVATVVVLGIMVVASAAAACEGGSYAVSVRLERERVGDATWFWLTGSVAPCPEGQTGRTVALSIIGPAGQVVFDGNVALNSEGSYRYEFHFQRDLTDVPFHLRGAPSGAGLYHVSVCYENARSEALIPILPPIGSAIIVAGYGDLQEAVNASAEYAYSVLRRSLCLPRDRIYFLHPDLATDCDFDGQPDVDALPTLENLRYAIENWAQDKFCTGEQDALWHTPLTVYIVSGSGGSNFFYINEADPVWAGDLACWLSTLKAGICRRQMQAGLYADLALPATVILECRMSGSFLCSLAKLHRDVTIVTSSQGTIFGRCESHIAEAGGLLSFGRQFWNSILLRASVGSAWRQAREFIGSCHGDQAPQISADGNGVPDEPSDEIVASQQHLHCGEAGDFTVRAEVCCATHTGTLRVLSRCVAGESVYLRAQVHRPHLAAECTVYIVAFPPPGVTESNIVLQLTYSPELGGYVGALPDGFSMPGVWQLLCVAEDPDGHLAVTSRELTTIAADVTAAAILSEVEGPPAPCNDDPTWLRYRADLLQALAEVRGKDSTWVADLVNKALQGSQIEPPQAGPLLGSPALSAPGLISGDCGNLQLAKPATCDADTWGRLIDSALQIPNIDVDKLRDEIQASLGQ